MSGAGPSGRPPATLGLWHVALNVRDLARMERFYVDVMGMSVEWRPDPANVYLTTGRDNLALHQVEGLPPPGSPSVLDHFGFIVDGAQAVDAWFIWIGRTYGPPSTEPRTHRDGARSFYLRDPEGNGIQIISHPPILEAERRR